MSNDNIVKVKSEIELILGINVYQQILMFKGSLLKNSFTFSEKFDRNTLHLTIRLMGGSDDPIYDLANSSSSNSSAGSNLSLEEDFISTYLDLQKENPSIMISEYINSNLSQKGAAWNANEIKETIGKIIMDFQQQVFDILDEVFDKNR